MREMPRMKTYSQQELATLLRLCADYLGLAYQELCNQDLNQLSQEAYIAADFLKYLVVKQQSSHVVH